MIKFIPSFRTNKKESPITLTLVDADYVVTIKYLATEITIISEKAFVGDDTCRSTAIVTKTFKAKVFSEILLNVIRNNMNLTNMVIHLSYSDSGHHLKDKRFHYILDSIEFRQKNEDLIAIEKRLNDDLDRHIAEREAAIEARDSWQEILRLGL